MLDIKFVRANPDVVRENIKKKFQDDKLPMVDEVLELDQRNRDIKQEVEALRAEKNKISKRIGACMAQGKKEEAEGLKQKVQESADRIEALSTYRNMIFRTTQKLWRALQGLIWRAQERWQETDSIILWAISQGSIPQLLLTPVTL